MKYVLLPFLALLVAVPAKAQKPYPRVEIFGGYSFLRTDVGFRDNIPKGWNSSVAANLHRNFGIEASFGGHYAHFGAVIPFDDSYHLFQAGPRVAFRHERLTPWAHALFGTSRWRATSGASGVTRTNFAWVLGGGLDARVHKKLAVRLVQADYLRMRVASFSFGGVPGPGGFGITVGPLPANNFRLSFGVVLRLGGG